MPITDDQLDERLSKGRLSESELAQLSSLAALATSTRDTAAAQGFSPRAVVLAASAGLIAGFVAAPAAADVAHDFLAQADFFAPTYPNAAESEFVDLGAPDLRQYLETIYPDWIPLAPGYTREQLIDHVATGYGGRVENLGEAFTQEVTLRRAIEGDAYCGWVDLWLSSPDQRSRASSVLSAAVVWPATTSTAVAGLPEMYSAFARAASAGDTDGVAFAAQRLECSSWDGADRRWWPVAQGLTPLEGQREW